MELLVAQIQKLQAQLADMQVQQAEDKAILRKMDTRMSQMQATQRIQGQQHRAGYDATIALSTQ